MLVPLCEAAWLLKASALRSLTYSWDLPPEASHEIWEVPRTSYRGWGKVAILGKVQNSLFFLTGLPSRGVILLETCLLGFFWKLSELGEGKYPTQAH